MVRVDLDVAGGLDAQVDPPVLGQLVQHVVEERHPGAHVGHAGAVEVKFDGDPCLVRGALGPPRPAGHESTSSRAVRKAFISRGVPIVTRSQPGGPTSLISTP